MKTSHITPAGGNVFADLGFPPEEAARLKAESDRIISEKLALKDAVLDVVKVSASQDYKLHLEFENGEKRIFDMLPYLDKKPFVQLKGLPLFTKASVDYGTVVWPGNIDIAPETLYDRSVRA